MKPRRGPRPVAQRLKRLLVILPWLTERGEATLAEMSERFQVPVDELGRDLELAAMCGLPPYLDELIDLRIEDGVAYVDVPRFFVKPLRLTAPEGFALLAGGRAAMQLPGADPAGPLGRALDKLEAALGGDGLVVELAQPPATGDLLAAAAEGEEVAITYWSAARDETTERRIVPRRVFADGGRWYVMADDDRSGEQRTFRVDRIGSWARTGVVRGVGDVPAAGDVEWFADMPDLPVATVRISAEAAWAVERLPVRSVTADGDATVVELPVASERFLTDLLLRLGPAAEVLEPEQWRGLAARAAAGLLAARYAG